jgi:hypothetical protein
VRRALVLLAVLLALPPARAAAQPLPTPSPAPLTFALPRVGVVPGGTLSVGVRGGVPPFTVTTSFAVDAVYDAVQSALVLTGRAPGSGTVTLTDATGETATLPVLVAAPAGVVPAETTVQLAGVAGSAFALGEIQALIAAAAQLRPGASLTVGGVSLPVQLRPGDTLDAPAAVTLAGNGRWVDVAGSTLVHLRVVSLPPLDPTVLFYSDDPERITAAEQGVLFHGTIGPTRPARIYAYHLADQPRRVVVVLNATGGMVSDVQIVGTLAGPSALFAYVGHLSTVRYLLARGSQQSVVVTVAPDAPFLLDLGVLAPGQLVAAIDDLRVLDGNTVDALVIAADPSLDPIGFLQQPMLPGDGHGRRGEFSLLDVPPLALALTVGAPEPAPFVVGVPTLPNLTPGGRALGGDYGVLRSVALQLVNPTPTTQNVYLYEQLGKTSGGTTTTIWFTGDPAPIEVPCILTPGTRYLVRGFAVGPNANETVGGQYMTDGTSSFPLFFGLTSTPPETATPGLCTGKPPPSPAPTTPAASGPQ